MDHSTLEEKIHDLRNIYERILQIPNDYPRLKNRQDIILTKFFHELDYCVNRAEDIYYRLVLKNKDVSKIANDMDRDIKMSRKMMEAIFPFIIMSNMIEQDGTNQNMTDTLH